MDNCFCVDSLSPNSSHELGEYLYIKLKEKVFVVTCLVVKDLFDKSKCEMKCYFE